MSNLINYRFRSMKNYTSIQIEGSAIPLWELKYEIITQRKMTSKDFDLIFYDGHTNEKINDEYQLIERNSHIIVDRVPLWMSQGTFILKDKKKETRVRSNRHVPPDSYVCFRCGNKRHFIQHCPTNEDKSFDIARIRKPSGIPKDFLVPVCESDLDTNAGMLVTPEGYYVKAQPQVHEWKRRQVNKRENIDIPDDIKCNLCKKLLVRPVKTNCKHVFCEACISPNDNCVVCGTIITAFSEDIEIQHKIDKFMDESN